MPLVIHYLNPNMRPDIVQGSSWRQLDQNTPALGTIHLSAIEDGHRIIVNKAAVAKVEEFSEEAWAMMRDDQKKAHDEAEAKKQADAEQVRATRLKAQQDANAAWARKFVVARWFTKKPYPEV